MNPALARDLLSDPFNKALCDLLFETDPMGLSIDGKNTDEYSPEVSSIRPRLAGCRTVEDVHGVVYEEFFIWFGRPVAPSREALEPVAAQVWELAKAHGIITPI